MTLRGVVGASLVLFAAALAYLFTESRSTPFAVSVAPESQALPPRVPLLEFAGSASGPASPQESWSPGDMPAVVAERWRRSSDQRAFFDRAVETGGGAHLHFALEAMKRCRVVNDYGMVGAEQIVSSRIPAGDPAQARRLDAYRAFIRGCEGFAMRRVPRPEVNAIESRLYEQDDAMGRAYNVKPYAESGMEYEEWRDTVRQLLATRDPYVLQVVAPHLAGADGDRGAWAWALCELGLDCTASGPYGNLYCFAIGKCDWKSLDDVADVLFAGKSGPPRAARKDEIVAAVRAGDWAKLE